MTIDEYILSHSDEEGALLSALNRDANVNLLRPRMLSGHLQGRILKMFCRMLRPRRVLEIGTYTGYATLCRAVMWWRSILRINKHSVFLVLMIKSKKTRVLKKLSYLCVTASR